MKLKMRIKAEYKTVNHWASMRPYDGICAVFNAPYLVRDDSERRTDEELIEAVKDPQNDIV